MEVNGMAGSQEQQVATDSQVRQAVSSLPDEAIDQHLEKDAAGEFAPDPDGKQVQQDTQTNEAAKPVEVQAPMEARIEEQKRFIGKQSTEIGQLKARIAELESTSNKAAQPKDPEKMAAFFEDPYAAVDRLLAEKELASRRQQAEAESVRTSSMNEVLTAVPDFHALLPAMLKVAREDGVPEEAIKAFEMDPWTTSPVSIKVLAKRAKDYIELSRLRGRGNTGNGASARPQVLTGSTGRGTSQTGPMSQSQISKLSDAELEQFLKGNNRNE